MPTGSPASATATSGYGSTTWRSRTDISGAMSSTHTLVAADVGKHFKVKVAFQDNTGFDEARTSKLYPARTGGICARTEQIRAAIVAATAATTCANVTATHLSGLFPSLSLGGKAISSLQSGDFAGLTGLTQLTLRNNALRGLPAGLFSGLTTLEDLNLSDNALSSLPANIFAGLTALADLNLSYNALSSLPAGIFDGLTALDTLCLNHNALSSLRANVFQDLTTLTTLDPAAQLQPRALRANGGGGRDPKGGAGCRGGARRQQQQPVGHERDLCVDAGERRAGHAHRRRHRAPEFHRPLDRRRPGVHADGYGAALGATGTDTVTVSVIDPRTLVTLSALTVSAGILDSEFDTDEITDTASVLNTVSTLTATANGPNQINLDWTAPANTGNNPITGYRIEVSTDGSNGSWTDRPAALLRQFPSV